jgi:hypothetical protein
MDKKIRPLKVYTIVHLNNVKNEEEYTIENEAKNNPQWGKESIVAKFLHIAEIYQCPTFEDPPIYR